MTVVSPSQIQCGDEVRVDGFTGIIKSIDGPDFHGVFDIYLTNGQQEAHKIAADPVILIG